MWQEQTAEKPEVGGTSMLRISQLKIEAEKGEKGLKRAAAKALGVKERDILSLKIKKRSLDARKKPQIFYVYTVDVTVENEMRLLKSCKNPKVSAAKDLVYHLPKEGSEPLAARPVIIGMGPAGLFCALALARRGFCPLILERGADMDRRWEIVEHFWNTGELDSQTNIQFGEGGAGTFSDGKLNTAVKDPTGRNTYVLKTFVEFGAPEEILYLGKPHIGTDLLRQVIKNIRREIERLGGEIRFLTKAEDLLIENGRIAGIVTDNGDTIFCEAVVLAIGHSARDTFEMLKKREIPMSPKAFAVGVRAEHPQKLIDRAQYGKEAGKLLPAADYKLTCQLPNGRGVYSFCMCPGGYVVNASSEEERLAVNGMSYHSRAGKNANSAIVVTVTPEDYGTEDVLAGVRFQRRLEHAAYCAGKGCVPVQRYEDFCKNRISERLGTVEPSIKGKWSFGNVRACFPDELARSLQDGMEAFGKKISGFNGADVLLSGVESRTSSPVRIERGEGLQSTVSGLYPCGEGAGYAGGITSAAMDGLRVAEAILKKFKINYCVHTD